MPGRQPGRQAHHEPRLLAAVVLGGGVGTLLRGALGEVVPVTAFPWATFTANVVACLVLAVATVVLADVRHRHRLALVGTGVCGGLSTFSTVQVETVRMLQDGDLRLAAAYVGVSVAAGLVTVVAGTVLARQAMSVRRRGR